MEANGPGAVYARRSAARSLVNAIDRWLARRLRATHRKLACVQRKLIWLSNLMLALQAYAPINSRVGQPPAEGFLALAATRCSL
jgi:hypothetical protein